MIGLEEIMTEYEETDPDDMWREASSVDLKAKLTKTLLLRKLSDDDQKSQLEKAILDNVHGHDDTCTSFRMLAYWLTDAAPGHRCHGSQGVALWGRTSKFRLQTSVGNFLITRITLDWHLLRGFIPVSRLIQMLEGHLARNSYEVDQIVDHLMHRDPETGRLSFDWPCFMAELYDMDTDGEGPWDKDQWHCHECIITLLQMRLRKWWIVTKMKSKSIISCRVCQADHSWTSSSTWPTAARLLVWL